MGTLAAAQSEGADNSLLLVDDDKPFLTRLAQSDGSAGLPSSHRGSLETGKAAIKQSAPAFAVVDMRLEDGSGLEVIPDASGNPARLPGAGANRLRQYRDGCDRG